MDLTPEELEAARKAAPQAKRFGKVVFIDDDGTKHNLIFRNPNRMEDRQYQTILAQDGRMFEANELLATMTAVVPDSAGLNALLNDYPGVLRSAAVTAVLSRLSGSGRAEDSK